MSSSTELIAAPAAHPGQMSVFDRMADPMEAIDKIGMILSQSGAGGCKTPADGKLLALACMCKRQDPFEIFQTYHLIEGKLSMKADAMLAKLRQAGGEFKWIKDGKDGVSASIELSYRGQTYVSEYAMAQAQAAGLVKPNSGWAKNPANMMRARAISDGMRMVAPEIIAGMYTPEEVEGFSDGPAANPQAVQTTAAPVATSSGRRGKAAAQEPQQQAQTVTTPAATQPAQPVVQAAAAVSPSPATSEAVAQHAASVSKALDAGAAPTVIETTAAPANETAALLVVLDSMCAELGVNRATLSGALAAKAAKDGTQFPGIDNLDAAGLSKLIENLKAKVEAKKAAAAAAA